MQREVANCITIYDANEENGADDILMVDQRSHFYPYTYRNSDQNIQSSGCMIWSFISAMRKEEKNRERL
jgi:hypothetical protein